MTERVIQTRLEALPVSSATVKFSSQLVWPLVEDWLRMVGVAASATDLCSVVAVGPPHGGAATYACCVLRPGRVRLSTPSPQTLG